MSKFRENGSISTEFSRDLGISYPLVGAPMFLVTYEELAGAVSQSGGIGCLPLPNYRTLEELKQALDNLTRITDSPIGVNVNLSGKFTWKEQLAICLDYGVGFFITALGDPAKLVNDVRKNGGRVYSSVISMDQGMKARDSGVDGIVAVGAGAGGHGGTIPTMVFVPYLKEHVQLPVLAAGGIATGYQMAAAIALGASGVVVGTRLIATPESSASAEYKSAVLRSNPEDIVYTDRITGHYSNWIAESIQGVEAGPDFGSRKWLDLWSAGKSVAQSGEILAVDYLMDKMVDEYFQAKQWLQDSTNY